MAALKSWVPIPPRSHFSPANIPFGIISTASNSTHRPAIAIGDYALDLSTFMRHDGFSKLQDLGPDESVFTSTTLNAFAELGQAKHRKVRGYLQSILAIDTPYPELLKENIKLREKALIPLKEVQTHLPLTIGDYTDFFAGQHHAFNVGTLFRGPNNALQPNYTHLPVAYHSRASSVVISGTPLHRPWGQVITDPKAEPKRPTFTPCRRLDIELELGMFVSRASKLGEPVPIDQANEYIFGYVLMNDWSARDIQQWEYVPLGPFNAKNFGTTISPWVVLPEALEPFRIAGIENPTELQGYLRESRKDSALDIKLEANLKTLRGSTTTITRTSSKYLIWSWPQMIAHHTISGCNLRTGDLFGSGTVSGPIPGTHGSILEQTQGGVVPLKLDGGEQRRFLEDGDTITITGVAGERDEELVGFGECTGKILPAVELIM